MSAYTSFKNLVPGLYSSTGNKPQRKDSRESELTTRSRLLLDQRTPAERDLSREAKRSRRQKYCWILWAFSCIFLIVATYISVDILADMMETPEAWSLRDIVLPSGFKIEKYYNGNSMNRMLSPRSLHVSQYQGSTILYVGSGTAFVYALIDYESDGINDAIFTQIFQSTLSFTVYSIAVHEQEQTLYIDDGQNIYRCANVHQQVIVMRTPQDR